MIFEQVLKCPFCRNGMSAYAGVAPIPDASTREGEHALEQFHEKKADRKQLYAMGVMHRWICDQCGTNLDRLNVSTNNPTKEQQVAKSNSDGKLHKSTPVFDSPGPAPDSGQPALPPSSGLYGIDQGSSETSEGECVQRPDDAG